VEWLGSVDVNSDVGAGDEKRTGGGEAGGDFMSLSFLLLLDGVIIEPFDCLRVRVLSLLETNSGAMCGVCDAFDLSPSQFFNESFKNIKNNKLKDKNNKYIK
jgi:hypothetical protein